MRIALIDNYDSFTYNLIQCIEDQPDVLLSVVSNQNVESSSITHAEALIISPGPGIPAESGALIGIINEHYRTKPILGVCLGMQAIFEVFGGKLENLVEVHHGVSSLIRFDHEEALFSGLPNPFRAGRYHSWVCNPATIPESLIPLAWDEYGELMTCRHAVYPIYGVQFHPESFLTPDGPRLLSNFLTIASGDYQPKM